MARIVHGGCWGTRPCPRHPFVRALRTQGLHAPSHCVWWVLGHARVSPAHTLLVVGAGARSRVLGTGARARTRCVRKGCTRARCQRKHCLPCDDAAVCPEFDTRLLGIRVGMCMGLSRPSRNGSGAKAAKSNRAESSACSGSRQLAAWTTRSVCMLGYSAITPRQGVTEGCVVHAINHTCHTDFENCKFVHSGITNVPRGGGRQKDEKVARCRRTSVVYVKTTKFVERDVEIFANYGNEFRFAGGCVCHLCCVDGTNVGSV
jgi:hypothetical protein